MKSKLAIVAVAAAVLAAPRADAHIAVSSGPAAANTTSEVAFSVGHGCRGADTYSVTIDIPEGVTSVRPMRSDFGKVSVGKDDAGAISSVTWQKADAEALDEDISYYKLVIRLKTPDRLWQTIYFKAHQTCRAADGTLTTVHWVGIPGTGGGEEEEPAAPLILVAPRMPGWNRITVSQDMPDLATFFKDAQIVWKGAAAYSANPTTVELITATSGVTALSSLNAGDEIWVRY